MWIAEYFGKAKGPEIVIKMRKAIVKTEIRLAWLLVVVLLLSTTGCSVSREKKAEQTFNEAIDAYMARRYNKAKLLLDSVLYTYPDMKKLVRESKDMLEIIYKTEQERNLMFLDSLLIIREKEVKPLMAQFEAEDPESENPVLIHKKQNAQHAWDRAYVRAHVDKNGTFYVSSHYTGTGYIHHYAVKAVVDDMFQTTDSIGEEAYKHCFEDGENVWEIVKYKNGADNGVASFIANNFDKPIDIHFIGEHADCRFRMTETDKQAFRETYQMAMLLRETVQIKSQIRNVKMAMKKRRGIEVDDSADGRK